MKGKLITVALFTTLGMASSVLADDGKVNFTGNIIEEGCQIDSSMTTPQTIKLGDVVKASLTTAGAVAANTSFTLKLSGCPDDLKGKPVVVKYTGTPDSVNNDYLQLTDAGTTGVAEGVAIQLLNGDGSALPLAKESKPATIDATAGTATMNFSAQYIATTASVTSGRADGTVNFTLSYN